MCTVAGNWILGRFHFVFVACGAVGHLDWSVTGTKVFQFIYFFSSFWNQFGPNCTTFLVAGERLLCTLCMPCRLPMAAATLQHVRYCLGSKGTRTS